MDRSFWLGVLFATLASGFLNIGKGIQKWKVNVLGQGRRVLHKPFRRDFGIWLLGVALTMGATALFSFALKFADKSSTVSALNGVGLIGLVLFAWLVLGERVGAAELAGASLVIVGTCLMGYLDAPCAAPPTDTRALLVCLFVISVIFCPLGIYSWRTRRWHGLVFGALAGTLIGGAMILGDLALLEAENDLWRQFASPYVYAALVSAGGALAVTQLAFWRADAMVVVPTVNSFVVFTPAWIQYFVFGTLLHALEYTAIAIIVAGVVLLTRRSKV